MLAGSRFRSALHLNPIAKCPPGTRWRWAGARAALPGRSKKDLQATVDSRAAHGLVAATEQSVLDAVATRSHKTAPLPALIIMFTAQWCGPCKAVTTELITLQALLGPKQKFEVLVVDVDECSALASSLGVKALPCLVFVGQDPSKPCISTVGPVSKKLIRDVIENKMHICGSNLQQRLRLS